MEPKNLNSLDKQPLVAEIDQSVWKAAVLGLINIGFAFGFSLFLKIFLINISFNSFLWTLALVIGFFAFFLLDAVLIKAAWRGNTVIMISGVALLAGFWGHESINIFWGAAIATLFMFWSRYVGEMELKNLLIIKFWRIGKVILPRAILAIAVFSSFAYYAVIKTTDLSLPENFLIKEGTFIKIINPVMPLVQKFLPEFDLSITTGDFLTKMANDQVANDSRLKDLPNTLKQPLIKTMINEWEKQFSDYLGRPLDTRATIGHELYAFLLQKIINLPENEKGIVPLGAAFLVFLTLISMTWLIRWIAAFIALLIYEIFLALGFSVILMEGRNREIVVLK